MRVTSVQILRKEEWPKNDGIPGMCAGRKLPGLVWVVSDVFAERTEQIEFTNPECLYNDGVNGFKHVGRGDFVAFTTNLSNNTTGHHVAFRRSALHTHEVVNTGKVVDAISVTPDGCSFSNVFTTLFLPQYKEV